MGRIASSLHAPEGSGRSDSHGHVLGVLLLDVEVRVAKRVFQTRRNVEAESFGPPGANRRVIAAEILSSFSATSAPRPAFYPGRMNDEAYERVVREHKDRVFSHAVWLLREREEARDVAQEALVRLWEHRAEVDEAAAKGWLLTTAHRMGLDRHRRSAVRAEVDTPVEDAAGPDPNPGPEKRAAWSSVGGLLDRALGQLSDRDRAAVLLRDVEGFSYGEISGALGVSVGTVKAALHRSRERLRQNLARAGVRP